tara:strand:+ start:54 stop:539 length:486 start_codon:yes stop_codon:yes gene_type:complete
MSTLTVKAIAAPVGYDLQMPAGHIIQVVQSGTIAEFSTSSTGSWIDSPVVASITPTSSSSKILVTVGVTVRIVANGDRARGALKVLRGSTAVWNEGGLTEHLHSRGSPVEIDNYVTISFLDSPNTTSSTTYKLQVYQLTGTNMVTRQSTFGTKVVLQEVSG